MPSSAPPTRGGAGVQQCGGPAAHGGQRQGGGSGSPSLPQAAGGSQHVVREGAALLLVDFAAVGSAHSVEIEALKHVGVTEIVPTINYHPEDMHNLLKDSEEDLA
ncbi:uncharacterized protein LOC105913838 [Setaria italica]|uniref:uncharacterized protein LOC105913838 n=1 Tax=Setaria italica TaxID=4555 RepID=UPI000648D75B|nr:uncharacterized protein LOC105913838 [Setaria italica]XP_034595643.1 uncharacterized protein LOC117857224 [Setaria viridis]